MLLILAFSDLFKVFFKEGFVFIVKINRVQKLLWTSIDKLHTPARRSRNASVRNVSAKCMFSKYPLRLTIRQCIWTMLRLRICRISVCIVATIDIPESAGGINLQSWFKPSLLKINIMCKNYLGFCMENTSCNQHWLFQQFLQPTLSFLTDYQKFGVFILHQHPLPDKKRKYKF